MNDQIQIKFKNLMSLAKSYNLSNRFMLLKDHEGWTDCFIADLTNRNVEVMKAKAILLRNKLSVYRVEGDTLPNIKPIIPLDEGRDIDDIVLDLSDNNAILTAGDVKVKVNPSFLKYFYANYKDHALSIKVIDYNKPLVIYGVGNVLLGMVMPFLQ